MILGIDHIAQSAIDLRAEISAWEGRGYTCAFISEEVANNGGKEALLETYEPDHDIAYLRSPNGGIAVELTRHGTNFGAVPSPISFEDGGTIAISVADVAREAEFLKEAFRFRAEEESEGGATLRLETPVPNWCCTIELARASAANPSYRLDAPGFTCLAFLSSDIEADAAKAEAAGGQERLPVFEISIDAKPLKVTLLRSPNGIIFELIQILKTS